LLSVQETPDQAFMLHHDVDGAALARSMGHSSQSSPTGTLPLEDRFRRSLPPGATFKNPILPAPSADPWVILHEGNYYSCESRKQESIWIRQASCFTELNQSEGTLVWSAPEMGSNSKSVWAPELHRINNKWYIYYAADDGLNENHRMWVLESLTDDPTGPYRCRGSLETSGWAIDGTVLQLEDGSLYYIWSGWPGKVNGQQFLYIAPMRNPWTLGAERTLIARPEHAWESVDMAICEGPQVLRRDGRTFIIYSASGSWTEDYCLGLIELTGRDPLGPSNWTKHGCVFCKTDYVWGIGHCSFVKSRDGSEDWIIYHAKTKRKKGWNDRNVRAQRFSWTEDGLPDFGTPIPTGRSIPVPAGSTSVTIGL
jgi:GH43 family beta-xylosidase